MSNKHSIFISKSKDEIEHVASYLKTRHVKLVAESFLEFEEASFEVKSPYEILFFGSPRSVNYFLASEKINPDVLIACSGDTTAELISTLGYSVSFNAGKYNSLNDSVLHFTEFAKGKHVLFPSSQISLRTYSKCLEPEYFQEKVVYKTHVISKKISDCTIYFFTSPSNVKGFFTLNEMPDNYLCYAWGESTGSALKSNGVEYNLMASSNVSSVLLELKKLTQRKKD